MVDGIVHSFNPRRFCVYYKRQLMSIMFISLRIVMRTMEESTGKIVEIREVLF